MRPLTLTARNFRSYPRLDVTFDDGMTAILGELRDAPDGASSNGAGKSSILEAVDVALFGRRSLAPYLTRGTDDDLLVELTFEHAGETYRVRRTFSARGRGRTTLDFECASSEGTLWQPLTVENAKATQTRIETTIGLTADTYRNSSYLRQGDGSFADPARDPRERKQLLVEAVLGRDPVWPRALDAAKVLRRIVEADVAQLQGRMAQASEIVAGKYEAQRARGLAMVECDKAKGDLEAFETVRDARAVDLQAARAQESVRAALVAEHAAAEQTWLRVKSHDDDAQVALTEIASLEPKLALLEVTAARLPLLGEQAEKARETVAAWEKATIEYQQTKWEIKRLLAAAGEAEKKACFVDVLDENAKCEHCGQTLGGEATKAAIASYRAEAKRLEDAVAALPILADPGPRPTIHVEDTTDAEQASRKLAAIQERLIHLRKQAETRPGQLALEGARLHYAEKRDALNAHATVDTAAVDAEAREATIRVASAQRILDDARATLARLDERLAQIATAEAQLAENAEQTAALQQRANDLRDVEQTFSPNGIPALIIENSAIPYLETEATRILALLGCPFTVELRTQAALKSSDGVKETLDVVVIDAAGEEAPFETFSGGEQTRVGLALRIALARLLAHRGSASGILCLDEPSFLDEAGMAALVEVLRGLQDDFAVILLVSHVPALRDSFDRVLTVVKDGERSMVPGQRSRQPPCEPVDTENTEDGEDETADHAATATGVSKLATFVLGVFVVFCVCIYLDVRQLCADECSCDDRFVDVAHDVDCPEHGFASMAKGTAA